MSAQRSRGGGDGGGGGGGDFGGGGAPTPFDELVDALDLEKPQIPAVAALLEGVERDGATLFQELIQRRQDLLNAETNHSTDPAAATAYTATVTKLIALETKVFQEIFAQLKPNQRQKAAKGFERLEQLFRTTLSTSGSPRGGGGRGGPGRGMPPQGGGR
jgi:hypothetical protein